VWSLVLALTVGAVDFGRYAITYLAVTNGARAGAGVGSMNSYTRTTLADWEQKVRGAVIDEVDGIPGFDESQLQIPTPVVTYDSEQSRRVSVEVRYPFRLVAPWPQMPEEITLTQTVEMPFIR